jgi:hypothetical protein
MARTPELKHAADNLIGGRERPMLNCFGQRLQRFGWSYKLNKHIQHGVHGGELDLLGYTHNEPNAVAVVEWKSILAVDEIHEVRAATTELISAQDQVLDRVEILRTMPIDERRGLYPFVPWEKITRYVPLVVTKDIEPNHIYDQTKVPCLCVDNLIAFGRSQDSRSPSRLAKFAASRPWLQKYVDLHEEFREVQIGDYVYEIPVLVEPLED